MGSLRHIRSIRVRAFSLVLQHAAGFRVNADLMDLSAALDVEGVAKTAAAAFVLKLLIGDLARAGLQRDDPSLVHGHVGLRRQVRADIGCGLRSTNESDQHRALMMPQELIQMASHRLLVLRAGMPPVRGDKIVYWREKRFAGRVSPPPNVAPFPGAGSTTPYAPNSIVSMASGPSALRPRDPDDLTLELIIPALEAGGLEPLPETGASEAAVQAWVERFIDASVQPTAPEPDHGR